MTVAKGEHRGILVSTEPIHFINLGIHIDIESPNVILYILWWQILIGTYNCEIAQPHWKKVYDNE